MNENRFGYSLELRKTAVTVLLQQCKKRDKDTLLPLIKKFILPGTKIFTDGWKAYNTLEQEGYIHGVVNHSVEFVNKDGLAINMQKTERLWKSLKNELKREGQTGENDDMYIFQFMYLHQQRNRGTSDHSRYFCTFSGTSRLYTQDTANRVFGQWNIVLTGSWKFVMNK